MKKLISVFAAMALVGSLAAAPRRPAPAKAPAKPVVAVPTTPTAVAAPVAAKSGGIGLFIEGFGGYTLGQGSSVTVEDGRLQTAAETVDTVRTNKSQNTAGLAFGGQLGYQLVEHLGLVAGFNYRKLKGREYSNSNATGTWTRQTENTIMGITLGFRPSVAVGPGRFYAGAGWLITLPFTETTNMTGTGNGGSFTLAADTTKVESQYNISLKGMYAELGYNFDITSNLYVGIGVRGAINTSDNIGKTTVTTTVNSGVTNTSTTTFQESASATQITAAAAANTATVQNALSRGWETKGITEVTANINIGFRF